MSKQQIYVLGGGTFSHVRNHMALSAPAFGGTARRIVEILSSETDYEVNLVLTKMADSESSLITNKDVADKVDLLLDDPLTKIIFFNTALCDFDGSIDDVLSGSLADRLKTINGSVEMLLTPADKVISRIREKRKDIFLVAFKTTTNATEDQQYLSGLQLLKKNSCNIVLANDTVNGRNMIVVPEEARYCVTNFRNYALSTLVEMALKRSQLTFTRSTVVPGQSIDWNSSAVPEALRTVVNHCIAKGAYKPFNGNTAGHFAAKISKTTFLTSKRKTNYNFLDQIDSRNGGLVQVESTGIDSVVAHGFKPSVGGQSQRIVFDEHPDYDCIVHFHCPPLPDRQVPTRPQQWLECGSHECGANTSRGLELVEDGIKAVYLDNHGPNIVFRRDADPQKVINFIDRNFDLSAKTGGMVA